MENNLGSGLTEHFISHQFWEPIDNRMIKLIRSNVTKDNDRFIPLDSNIYISTLGARSRLKHYHILQILIKCVVF